MDVFLTKGNKILCSAPLWALSCHSKVAIPTELSVPCPFPASPYRENWHSEPHPLCQLAKSEEGRCSVSDITTKISPGLLRRALLSPCFLQETGTSSLRPPWPSHSILTLEEAVQTPTEISSRKTLSFPPSLPASPSPCSSPSDP